MRGCASPFSSPYVALHKAIAIPTFPSVIPTAPSVILRSAELEPRESGNMRYSRLSRIGMARVRSALYISSERDAVEWLLSPLTV